MRWPRRSVPVRLYVRLLMPGQEAYEGIMLPSRNGHYALMDAQHLTPTPTGTQRRSLDGVTNIRKELCLGYQVVDEVLS